MIISDISPDIPAPGLAIYQPRNGFRYGAEAFWLAGMVLETTEQLCIPVTSALDLGTGSGIIALLLASTGIPSIGIDRLPDWQRLWNATLEQSRPLPVSLQIDELTQAPQGPFSIVVSNPPFFPPSSGPISPNRFRAAARTESSASLADFIFEGWSRCCGLLAIVIPVERAAEAQLYAQQLDMTPAAAYQIGARRTILSWQRQEASKPFTYTCLDEHHPQVQGWYLRFRGKDRTAL